MRTKKLLAPIALSIVLSLTFSVSAVPAALADTSDSKPARTTASTLVTTKLPTPAGNRLSDNGCSYTYNLDDGTTATYYVPPKGFNPLNATDAQLAKYHFPSRPTDPAELKYWKTQMSMYKSTPIPAVEKVDITHRMKSSTMVSNTTYRDIPIWSGVEDSPSSTMKYTKVEASFTQPRKIDSGNTYESSWIGIGGDNKYNSTDLIQCGTSMNLSGYHLWWEKLNSSSDSHEQQVFTIRPGDSISILVSYSLINNYVDFYLSDNTTGQATIVTTYAGQYFDGSTAEFIEESPRLSSGGFSNLANYVSVTWKDCRATLSNSSTSVTNDAYYFGFEYLRMRDQDSNHILSQPNAFSSSTSFMDVWKNSY